MTEVLGVPTIDVVMTTIGDGTALREHAALLDKVDDSIRERVRLIAIPDCRTPPTLYRAAEDVAALGISVLCPTLEEQEVFLASLGAEPLVTINSDNRRNVGYLLSWRDQRDVVISVDDDNFPMSQDFYEDHAIVAAKPARRTVTSATGRWYNICDLLVSEPPVIWPRGFPYYARLPAEVTEASVNDATIAVNAGIWIGDPDVDGMTRAAMRPKVATFRSRSVILADDTWSPVNSQNTAVRCAALPAYYFPKLRQQVDGVIVDRFADIFSGLFVQACAKNVGDFIRLGSPPVRHDRNHHDVLNDVALELPLIRLLEDLAPVLLDVTLDGADYCEAYLALASVLDDAVEQINSPVWAGQARAFVHNMTYSMRLWIRTLNRIHRISQ